ncbi:MAG: heme-binding protein [Acidimicrobiia bacterium]|nr:heme-binding protein [Acidimicrobiia bacterium]MBT8216724.1 heme-binding protein [Acidimicrobiia bacterium]NNF10782.1 heme-binding protein [Acidimicrobiia bacterium]NNL69189.1 heme-binding protein [Acidimicrobiia bacterium]
MARSEISHRHAAAVIAAVQAELEARDGAAAVAVVDPHGELVGFLRTDGCPLASINNAINKAFTAARERVESAEIGARSRADGFPMTNFGDLRYTGWGGGVPLLSGDAVIGAVGVSGLPEDEDIELARLGAAVPAP